MYRMLVEIWTVKAILMRSQVEIRNVLLDHREKAILCYKVAGTWLNWILWKVEGGQ